MRNIYILMFLHIVLFASATKTYTTGDTFKFAEKNMINEITQSIQDNRPQIEKKLKEMKENSKDKIKNFKPKDMITMTPATKNKIFYPDMKYTNPKNIYDNEGKLIYPKGFTFNPLDYQKMTTEMIIIDGKNKDEIKWLQDNGYTNNMRYQILLSDGNYQEVSKILAQHVFYCIPQISEKFKLKYTPSIVTQIGNTMRVKEICLKCKKEDK